MENEEPEPKPRKTGVPEAEQARRMRRAGFKGFLQLADLLHDDLKAFRAMREETLFIASRPNLPRSDEFAAKVRGWLKDHQLEWSQENLQRAVDAVSA